MAKPIWGIEDHLFRGDNKDSVALPDPAGPASIVRHILFLDGAGRATPYSSTTEDEETARRFAGKNGRIWYTLVARIEAQGLRLISNGELMNLLRGKGKGEAAWPKATQVLRARQLAEEHAEHLVDFRSMKGKEEADMQAALATTYAKNRT